MSVPSDLVPSLSRSTPEQLENWELAIGRSLYWSGLDEGITAEALVLDKKIIDWKKVLPESQKA